MLNPTTQDIRGYFKTGAVFSEQDIENLILLLQLEQLLSVYGGLSTSQIAEYKRLTIILEPIAELDNLIIVT